MASAMRFVALRRDAMISALIAGLHRVLMGSPARFTTPSHPGHRRRPVARIDKRDRAAGEGVAERQARLLHVARQDDDVVAAGEELRDEARAHEPGRAGDGDAEGLTAPERRRGGVVRGRGRGAGGRAGERARPGTTGATRRDAARAAIAAVRRERARAGREERGRARAERDGRVGGTAAGSARGGDGAADRARRAVAARDARRDRAARARRRGGGDAHPAASASRRRVARARRECGGATWSRARGGHLG